MTDLALSCLFCAEQDTNEEFLELLASVPDAPKAYWNVFVEKTICTTDRRCRRRRWISVDDVHVEASGLNLPAAGFGCYVCTLFKFQTSYRKLLLLLAGTFEGTLYLTIRNSYMIFGINYTTQCHQQHIEKCHTHLVSLIKHHGLFVPYNVTNFTVSFYSFNS